MLKIDIAKAFDRIEWNFVVVALARKGLHCHFIKFDPLMCLFAYVLYDH
jgi:hypothetical protein